MSDPAPEEKGAALTHTVKIIESQMGKENQDSAVEVGFERAATRGIPTHEQTH